MMKKNIIEVNPHINAYKFNGIFEVPNSHDLRLKPSNCEEVA